MVSLEQGEALGVFVVVVFHVVLNDLNLNSQLASRYGFWAVNRIKSAKDNDWSNDECQDKHGQTETNQDFLPKRLRFSKLMVHVCFVGALGQVQVCLHLSKLNPLEDI